MKIIINFYILLIIKEMSAASVAFATPIYSNSYLPASMQIILHAVEQLKQLQSEESQTNPPIIISTSPHPPGLTTWQIVSRTGENIGMTTVSLKKSTENHYPINKNVHVVNHGILGNKFETTEPAHVTPALNHERVEIKPQDQKLEFTTVTSYQSTVVQNIETNSPLLNSTTRSDNTSTTEATIGHTEKMKVDNIVAKIYEIVKPSSDITEHGTGDEKDIIEKKESLEDLNEETRFTLLGERVSEAPRPSLTSYLRRSKVPTKASQLELASLYDSLSKDARKQGLSKYAGYSDEVLKTLETSSGGGIGPQIKIVLEKSLERNELTLNDSKSQVKGLLSHLRDSGSQLSTDLRHLLPLRFTN